METLIKVVGMAILVVGVFAGVSMLAAYPTMLIVNYLFTPPLLIEIFGIPALTFWKAFWLNFLCAGLFKSTSTSSNK